VEEKPSLGIEILPRLPKRNVYKGKKIAKKTKKRQKQEKTVKIHLGCKKGNRYRSLRSPFSLEDRDSVYYTIIARQNQVLRRKMKRFLNILWFGLVVFGCVGCATDNEFLAKLPLFEANSDTIPGLTSPKVRKKQIQLKGEKGADAPDGEKEILVAQLMVEYRTSPDQNMRREAVDAMAKIPHSKRDFYMKEMLKDDDPFIRISVLEAFGKTFNGERSELIDILIGCAKSDSDKDVRLRATEILGAVGETCSGRSKKVFARSSVPDSEQAKRIESTLGTLLLDKVPAMRYQSMKSLHQVTGKDYGENINNWLAYIQYAKGESAEIPKERSFTEKIPRPQLPMFK
jgi:hypothetical protein